MSRDTHHSQLKQVEYALGVNINTNSESGEGFNVQLEPSNYYGVMFPQGYKVIGFKTDLLKEKTYYLLVNTEATDPLDIHFKRSSIGYVDISRALDNDFLNNVELQDCGECLPKDNKLVKPLEDIVQTPSQQYVELAHDRCVPLVDLEEKGLNFDINFPAKKIEISQEKTGTTIFWDDNRNTFRYLNVTELEERGSQSYIYEVFEPCSDSTYQECINVDRLRLFPKHSPLKITPKEQQTGGNLKMGTYEFRGAYCDVVGNEMTQYSTPTNPISIWDAGNVTQSQRETDEYTNYAIKLKVDNLDTENFKYYKVAVVERNNVNATQSIFLVGIYPTTDDTVIFTHSNSNGNDGYKTRGNVTISTRMDEYTLNAIKPQWEKAKGTMVSGDALFHYGLKQKEELNLQPLFNLFGSLLHAQTSAASEDLYKSAIATSKYKGYPRNEVIPFSIRLLYKDGGYSANFPLIARPHIDGEKDKLTELDLNLKSITDNSSCITTERDEVWKVYNTAIPYETLCTNIESSAAVSYEDVVKTCEIPNVAILPTGEVFIVPDEEYYDFTSYIMENPSIVPGLQGALDATYIEECAPNFFGECTSAELVSEENQVGQITNEQSVIVYEEVAGNYIKSIPPKSNICNIYKKNNENKYIPDATMSPYMDCGTVVYERDSDFNNELCAYSESLINITNPAIDNGSSIFLNYLGANDVNDLLQSTHNVEPSTITANFKNKLHKKAQFFRVEKNNRNKIVLDITKSSACSTRDNLPNVSQVRYTIYKTCSTTPDVLGGGIVDLSTGALTILDTTTFPNSFYITIDSPIITSTVDLDCSPIGEDFRLVSKIVPPCGCFGVYTRDLEIKNVKVTFDSIGVDKVQKYKATCTFVIPKVNDCDPIPYRKFQTAYWESTEEYDNNKELWDSSDLKIEPIDLDDLSQTDRDEFLDYYVEGGKEDPQTNKNGFYRIKGADFRCKPIRHFKMPDNTTAPYIIDNITFKNKAKSIIFPIGVELDSAVVRAAIQLAYKNKIISKKQRDSIQGFEILRGDNTVSKSVIANGIAFDMYNYKKNEDTIYFPNFPYNDLGKNKYLTTERYGNELVDHPDILNYSATAEGSKFGNYMYSFISPDLFLDKPTIPTEASLQGYVVGASNQQFVVSDEHSEWTILGGKARRTAERLAGAEVALETILKVAELTSKQWFTVGTSSGTSLGLVASFVALAGFAAQGGILLGKYRYDWLKTFRDLGKTYNFASMQVGVGDYNKLLKVDQYSNNYLRKLAVRKYLEDGYGETVDENSGETIKVNNKVRETSALLSFGKNHKIEYDTDYKNLDNNKESSTSSNFVCSEVGGVENKYFNRDIASPYFSLKNYIPDQWGKIGSIKWLTTNNIFNLNEPTACKTMFGGTHVISRFSWRRKVPIFLKNAIKHPDKQPFMYSRYDNMAYPRFYCNYELTDGDSMWKGFLGLPFPDIDSDFNFDSETGTNRMYLKPPSKLYTSVHSIVDFLVESEINCNFRYARKEKKDWFYPQSQDLGDWLQEATLPLSEPNTFFYNNSYSKHVSNTSFKVLDKTYSKELWKKRTEQPNAVIYSQKDLSEMDTLNPWKVYKPNDWYEFKTNNGVLIDLHSIESEQFLSRFENKLLLHNKVDSLADRITPQNREVGIGSIFLQRPLEQKSTDLGFAGTQNTEILATPYGHYWCDAKRGKIFKVDQNGQGLEITSENIQGRPTGMKQWFREHLPFKILRYLPEIDIDNKFNGLGLNMWWDDKEGRVFITKRDYVPKTKDLCFSNGKIRNTSQQVIDNLIALNQVNGWVYKRLENCKLVFEKVYFEPCVEELKITITYRANNQTAPGGQTPPCFGGHTCNHAVFNVTGNGILLGEANLNNAGGVFDLQGRVPGYLPGGVGYLGQTDFDRYSEINVDTETIEDLLLESLDGTLNLAFDCGCVAGVNCDIANCHERVGWVRVYRNSEEIYNGCPVGNIVSGLELCENASDITTTEIKYVELDELRITDANYFEDVSWTIAFKPSEGTWNSYFSFYPDYSPFHNNFFQVGYNWGESKGTLWNHLLNRSSFLVFQGKKNKPIIEFVIPNENAYKMLNSISLNLEGRYHNNEWDWSIDKDKSFKNIYIYNQTNNTGLLELVAQKSLSDVRKYPITEGNTQKILFTSDQGKQNINYFFNRTINQDSRIPMFSIDKNNIFKTLNNSSVNFKGKRVLERIKGEYFTVHLEGVDDTRYNLILKNTINDETII